MASSLVCTSPLAVTTVVGFFEILMVSNSAELRSFLLTVCILAPESTTNSLSSGFTVDAAGIIPLFGRRKECSFVFLFEFVNISGKIPCLAAGRIALVFQSLLEICPQISQRMDFADEEV